MASATTTHGAEIERAAEALQSLFPDSALAWFSIGLAWSGSDPARARAATHRSIELDISFAQPCVAQHLFQMQDGDFDRARAPFEPGVSRSPEQPPARQRLLLVRAQACLKHDRFAEALEAAERALSIHASAVTALLLKARAQRGRGQAAARPLTARAPGRAPASWWHRAVGNMSRGCRQRRR